MRSCQAHGGLLTCGPRPANARGPRQKHTPGRESSLRPKGVSLFLALVVGQHFAASRRVRRAAESVARILFCARRLFEIATGRFVHGILTTCS